MLQSKIENNFNRTFTQKRFGYDLFLGGTTNESLWRNDFINKIQKKNPNIKCFNPVVEIWTPECIELENYIKQETSYHLYVITPKMMGVYSIAEAVESAMNPTKKTFFTILTEDDGVDAFDDKIMHSLLATAELIKNHGGIINIGNNLESTVDAIIANYNTTITVR